MRVQIRLTGDVSTGWEQSTTVASPEEAGALVDAWLQEILRVN